MLEALNRTCDYCQSIQSLDQFEKENKTFDACVRNLQILGDAANHVPAPIQKEMKDIPWKEIKGMRNILVHEYFGVSPSIVWSTIQKDLPTLRSKLEKYWQRINEPQHPWRICPPGEHYVRSSTISPHLREGNMVRAHLRREHCRENRGSTKDTLTTHEVKEIAEMFFKDLSGPPSSNHLGFGKRGTEFDHLIRGWVKYWNDVLSPDPPLDPDIVKALIASESSFNPLAGKKKRSKAKGLMQLMPVTVKSLNGDKNELTDHIFEFHESDVWNPNLNIAAGVRWLHQKRKMATKRLKREATWEEAVAEYKDYLKRSKLVREEGMANFNKHLKQLNFSHKLE